MTPFYALVKSRSKTRAGGLKMHGWRTTSRTIRSSPEACSGEVAPWMSDVALRSTTVLTRPARSLEWSRCSQMCELRFTSASSWWRLSRSTSMTTRFWNDPWALMPTASRFSRLARVREGAEVSSFSATTTSSSSRLSARASWTLSWTCYQHLLSITSRTKIVWSWRHLARSLSKQIALMRST